MFRRRHLCPGKKGGLAVGKTRKGKGTKLMVLVERSGLPIGVCVEAASVAEVNLAERVLGEVSVPRLSGPGRPRMKPERIVGDRAYDSHPLWKRLKRRGIDLIVPHLKNRRRRWQDGRKLRRYLHRWIVERTISWLFSIRRIVVQHERRVDTYLGSLHAACMLKVLRPL